MRKGGSHTKETLLKMRKSKPEKTKIKMRQRASFMSREQRKEVFGAHNKGKVRSVDFRKKVSVKLKGEKSPMWGKFGEKSPAYKDGLILEREKIRSSPQSREWRVRVFERDNYTCQITGLQGSFLCSHHIENFADNPELRFVDENGIIWNRGHHKIFHLIYGKGKNTREQMEEFISFCY